MYRYLRFIQTKIFLHKLFFIDCIKLYWEYKLVRSVFLWSKMHLFQNKMNEQINQSIVHRWLLLFPTFQAIFEFHLEKMSRLLRRSKLEANFRFLRKKRIGDLPNRATSVRTTNQKKRCPENTAGAVKYPT